MHEYSLVQALVSRVEEEARRRQALKVHSLSLRVGELSGVDPELLRSAYELFREGTVCAGVPLSVTRVAALWSCPRCKLPIASGAVLRCPSCALPAELSEGADALSLDSIEMEVP
ncbi:MAG TPA: hydrogenase maturation nickel metallochaperone HypA [Anaeromyxobacter sp.]|nr:hydrogenase maturation nickel metallochaperone HypA [Anaeromyxobacter sp.]